MRSLIHQQLLDAAKRIVEQNQVRCADHVKPCSCHDCTLAMCVRNDDEARCVLCDRPRYDHDVRHIFKEPT